MAATSDGADQRAQRAFDRAVARELESIATHERAAGLHDETAARLEQSALYEPNERRLNAFTSRAELERKRATAARDRANETRRRLRQEGIQIDD